MLPISNHKNGVVFILIELMYDSCCLIQFWDVRQMFFLFKIDGLMIWMAQTFVLFGVLFRVLLFFFPHLLDAMKYLLMEKSNIFATKLNDRFLHILINIYILIVTQKQKWKFIVKQIFSANDQFTWNDVGWNHSKMIEIANYLYIFH